MCNFEQPFNNIVCSWLEFLLRFQFQFNFVPLLDSGVNPTACVKDCGFHNKDIDMIILFACLVGWLNSLLLEI